MSEQEWALRWYDRDGAPMRDWALFDRLLGDESARRVASTNVGPYWISTVWLGLDHAWGGGPPLIFETMVFLGVVDGADDYSGRGDFRFGEFDCRRYATEAEAIAGHDATVALVAASLLPDDADGFADDA